LSLGLAIGRETRMAKKRLGRLAFIAVFIFMLFYGYKALQFDSKVKIFNSKIRVGESFGKVRELMGTPSFYDGDFRISEVGNPQGLRTRQIILMVYRGTYYFRSDLNLIFDRETRRLLEKNRAQYFAGKS
jgi:hypothetical protein